jgi:hypothetical protein
MRYCYFILRCSDLLRLPTHWELAKLLQTKRPCRPAASNLATRRVEVIQCKHTHKPLYDLKE